MRPEIDAYQRGGYSDRNPVITESIPMKTLSYTEARDHLKDLIDQVNEDHLPVHIQRRNGEGAVLMSDADYSGLQETLYLLGNPANAQRLLAARQRSAEGAVPWDTVKERLGL